MATPFTCFSPSPILSSSAASNHRKPDPNSRKPPPSSSSNWWTPLFGWSSDPEYINNPAAQKIYMDVDIEPSKGVPNLSKGVPSKGVPDASKDVPDMMARHKMASSSRGLLTLFPDLNETTGERTGAVSREPQPNTTGFAPLNFPMQSVEQKMAVQTDVEANQYTLKACVESMTAVTNLSHRLQSRTNEVQQLNSQLALLQRMYKDARAEISVLRAENKELKRKATVMFRFGGPPYAAVEEQGVGNLLGGLGSTEATPSRAVQDGGKKKRPAAEAYELHSPLPVRRCRRQVVCVTGGSSFIGSWLVRLLLDRGYTVHATVKDLKDEKETKHLEVLEGAESRLFQIDLLDYDSIVAAITGSSGVFHLASPCIIDQVKDPERELLEPAIKGTLNVLTAAKELGVRWVVVTSSISAITPSPNWPADKVKNKDCWTDVEYCKQNGLWYPLSKTLAEKAAWEFTKEKGLDVVVVNLGTVMGPIIPPALNASMLVLLRFLQGCTEIYENFFMGPVHVKEQKSCS
ncbi:hypothetical protein HYC85_028541 [Camellia sinensis]|uniref:Dihydroflavonol 4-reductase n=1 Tax=Camellia sinensis TaxID=4442 RepID=A0A7J7FVF4_CAMSI|nr:hypothetical protein HYC85_028541 [Camellia sinensis]